MSAMRRVLFLLGNLAAFASCKTVSNENRPTTQPSASAQPVAVVDAAPPPPAETALDWGTRPAMTGPLFPVVDGMCVHGEVWPTKGSAIFSYGNGLGPASRGGNATWARLTDDGLTLDPTLTTANDKTKQADFEGGQPYQLIGTWPAPLLLSVDNPSGRMRSFDTIWSHDETGWNVLASHNETGAPNFTYPLIYKGWAISSRSQPRAANGYDDWSASIVKAWPLDKNAPPIPKLETLGRADFQIREIYGNESTLYADGDSSMKPIVRWLADGKTGEAALPENARVIGTTPTALVVEIDARSIQRLENGKLAPVAIKLSADEKLRGTTIAPNGDIWTITTKNRVLIVKGDAVSESSLPSPGPSGPREEPLHSAASGDTIAGVEFDDPYAIAVGGALFHLAGGTWTEVPFPKPPFATQGKYAAQTLAMPAKGDLYVNAGYGEKGTGWKTTERYRAILRTKRPREVLRCNEPFGGSDANSGAGFMSFPPIADDACTTPVVLLVRLAWRAPWDRKWSFKYDPKSDYPSVRDAIKATPSLGASLDLVEIEAGDQRYLAAPVPNVAAGKALALAVVKHVKDEFLELRPEVVCGKPKAARVLHVDVATGKTTTAVTTP